MEESTEKECLCRFRRGIGNGKKALQVSSLTSPRNPPRVLCPYHYPSLRIFLINLFYTFDSDPFFVVFQSPNSSTFFFFPPSLSEKPFLFGMLILLQNLWLMRLFSFLLHIYMYKHIFINIFSGYEMICEVVMFGCLKFAESSRSGSLTMAKTSFKLEHPLGSFPFPF